MACCPTQERNMATAIIDSEVRKVSKEIKDVKENLSKVNKDVDEVNVMMSQVSEKSNMLEHLNKLPSPIGIHQGKIF